MPNEVQRPKKVRENKKGRDFTVKASGRKAPSQAAWKRYCATGRAPMQVEFLETRRGLKCFARKNDPENVIRATEPWDPEPVDADGNPLPATPLDDPTYADKLKDEFYDADL